jgi:hypothetical protein
MSNLNSNYERILEVLRKISKEQLLTYQKRKPKMTDLELISLSLTTQFRGVDSENDLFRNLPAPFLAKIERNVYNKRRRNLVTHLEIIHLKLASFFNDFEDYFVTESMPLKVCKLAISSRSRICKKDIYSAPNKGDFASQNSSY